MNVMLIRLRGQSSWPSTNGQNSPATRHVLALRTHQELGVHNLAENVLAIDREVSPNKEYVLGILMARKTRMGGLALNVQHPSTPGYSSSDGLRQASRAEGSENPEVHARLLSVFVLLAFGRSSQFENAYRKYPVSQTCLTCWL